MKILVNGCSYVAGQGLDHMHHDDNNFVNVFIKTVFPNAKIYNIAKPGTSNRQIFETTLYHLSEEQFELVFVGWTSYPRNHFYFGLELFDYVGHFFIQLNRTNTKIGNIYQRSNLKLLIKL